MSTRGTRGHSIWSRGRGRRGLELSLPLWAVWKTLDMNEMSVSPATETGSQSRSAGADALSQAMLRILKRVTGPHSRFRGHGLVTKRLRSNGAELFRGITRVAPTVVEYWLEATERIMNDVDCTLEQKLKGAVYLLRIEAYQWWLTVEEGTQPDRLNWNFFKTNFQRKYVGASFVDSHRRELMNLTQDDRSVAEYGVEFLRFNRYARGMVAFEYEKCVRFEDV
ncbi:hypothetical protein PVK06_024899 [Gossypium arboreum]|uniref:Retrotransposon gag domain-containing protein n=1 Tax=Gossypium arboreum TaxID=29729 RepID=A0ABR0PFK9_GOSAR|nr:hypothetical protein PVK06_024899 [Gossypium arboreum]